MRARRMDLTAPTRSFLEILPDSTRRGKNVLHGFLPLVSSCDARCELMKRMVGSECSSTCYRVDDGSGDNIVAKLVFEYLEIWIIQLLYCFVNIYFWKDLLDCPNITEELSSSKVEEQIQSFN